MDARKIASAALIPMSFFAAIAAPTSTTIPAMSIAPSGHCLPSETIIALASPLSSPTPTAIKIEITSNTVFPAEATGFW